MKKSLLIISFAVLAALALVLWGMPATTEAGHFQIRLWSGPRAGLGNILYTIELDSGPSPLHAVFEWNDVGVPILLFDNIHFFDGFDRTDMEFFYSVDRQRVYSGPNHTGEILYFLQPARRFVRVHEGPNAAAPIIYTFQRNRVHDGPNTSFPILLSTEDNFFRQDVPLLQAVLLLLEREPRLEAPEVAGTSAELGFEGLRP